MRIRDFREDDTPEINLIPLIDVVLCLIIFFVVTTTVRRALGAQAATAAGNGTPAESQTKALSVLVNAEGRYFIDDREALRTDVESLKQRSSTSPAPIARVRCCCAPTAARRTSPSSTALDALAQLGFSRVSIATAPPVQPAQAKAP
jgi:biopolymer transport protein ExbD